MPRTGTLTRERSGEKGTLAIVVHEEQIRHKGPTQSKETTQCETNEQEKEADEELAALADGGEKRAARCGLPDLMQ